MRAVVRRGPALVVDDLATPEPAAGQVLVRTLCCGICGSDLHAVHAMETMVALSARTGEPGLIDPARDIVFGHEYCAAVLDHGPGTDRRLKTGTRVVGMPVVPTPRGFETVGYSNLFPGGFAQQMVLTEAMLLPVPNGLSDVAAAMTEPFAVGEHAVAESDAGADTVNLVVGCGPVGLAVIAALKARGLGPVIASDYSPARRRLAEQFGADEVVDPAADDPHARWAALGVPHSRTERSLLAMTGGTGKRAVVFECVGVPGVIQSLIERVPVGTQILVVGVCMQTDSIEPFLCINKSIALKFVLAYTPDEFAATLRHIADGTIDVAPAVTGEVGLDGVADAFAALGEPDRHCKIVVRPGT
ncbi:alcohol dehydrogenase [Sphingomonas sp. Leaf412]|uniref:zinc-binding dehydrogenase n=1 Tax=Sphingomonas sp. Leaf412 TaxID=1736370 RepID=UPI0006F4A540|nr:zinc-binding dehydrogenase [Sphingomonas sp. Leaf412]KQT35374.1 alcohol dehydrogenase [Sphingomonas sp. Leaf412]